MHDNVAQAVGVEGKLIHWLKPGWLDIGGP